MFQVRLGADLFQFPGRKLPHEKAPEAFAKNQPAAPAARLLRVRPGNVDQKHLPRHAGESLNLELQLSAPLLAEGHDAANHVPPFAPGLDHQTSVLLLERKVLVLQGQKLFTGFEQTGSTAGLEEALKDHAHAGGVARDSRSSGWSH